MQKNAISQVVMQHIQADIVKHTQMIIHSDAQRMYQEHVDGQEVNKDESFVLL